MHAAVNRSYGGAGLTQLVDQCVLVVSSGMAQHHVATGCSDCAQEGARFNSVGHYLVGAAVQTLNALNANAARAVAFNFCPHFDKHFSQVTNLGFLGGVFQNRFAFCKGRRHQKVFCARYRHHVGGDAATLQARLTLWQLGNHVAVLDHNLSAHGLEALDVLINRARANRATAWQRYGGLAKAGQKRAECQHRRAHGFNQLVRRFRRRQSASIDDNSTRNAHLTLGVNSHISNELEHGRHVLQAWYVFQDHGVGCQQSSAQLRQRRVFSA